MIDHSIIIAAVGSFDEVWPYIAATAAAIAGPLLLAIKWQANTYKDEKEDLIGRLDKNNAEHRKEMREVLFPLAERLGTIIERDIESNGTLGSDLRDLKTTIEIYFNPNKPKGGQ